MPGIPHGALVAVEAVASAGEFLVGRGDFFSEEGVAEFLAVGGDYDAVVVGVGEEGGRGPGGDLELAGVEAYEFVAWIGSEEIVP